MRYEAISNNCLIKATIETVKSAGQLFCGTLEGDQRKVVIKYSVDKYGRFSHLKIGSISYEDENSEGPMVLRPEQEKYFPEDFLEEFGVLVKIHDVDGVYWNGLSEVRVISAEDYPNYYLDYHVVQALGPNPRVIFHEKKGDYFFKWHDEVTYKALSVEDISIYLSQASRIGSGISIPEWILLRHKEEASGKISYRPLRDCFNPAQFLGISNPGS